MKSFRNHPVNRTFAGIALFALLGLASPSWPANTASTGLSHASPAALFSPVSANWGRGLQGVLKTPGRSAGLRPLAAALKTLDVNSSQARLSLAPIVKVLYAYGYRSPEQLRGLARRGLPDEMLLEARQDVEQAAASLISQAGADQAGLSETAGTAAGLRQLQDSFAPYLGPQTRKALKTAYDKVSERLLALRQARNEGNIARVAVQLGSRGDDSAAVSAYRPLGDLAPAKPASTLQRHAGRPASKRLLYLDVYRGMTIVGMILVNSPGNIKAYSQLQHAAWNGWTFADLVFPMFLFIMGASVSVSMNRRVEHEGDTSKLVGAVLRRSAKMFALGVFTSYFTHEPTVVNGVLQRIALCYFFGSLLFIKMAARLEALVAGLSLGIHSLLLKFVPVPGFGKGNLTPEGNLSQYADQLILGPLFGYTKPAIESLLGTLPSMGTTLMGVLSGRWLMSRWKKADKAAGLFAAGALASAAGQFWGLWLPINKPLWTGSFALLSGGFALCGLAVCYTLIEILKTKFWTKPFEIFGRNALLSYMLGGLFYQVADSVPVGLTDGSPASLRQWLCDSLFATWLSPPDASLAFALSYTLFCLGVMTFLHRRKKFLKI